MKRSQSAPFVAALLFLPLLVSSQSCPKFCGGLPLRFPFGGAPGCGDPRFLLHVTCAQQTTLSLTTRTGSYPVTSIDYAAHLIRISDPSMSTCACSRRSRGFGLDPDAPFAFHESDVFTLLDCRNSSSFSSSASAAAPLCGRDDVCGLLSTCGAVSAVDCPVNCCTYAPVDLGPAFEMDLEKLQCGSYSGFYGHRGSDPMSWEYGVALRYKFNVDDELSSSCARCERRNGVCGYDGASYGFLCSCPGGVNTSSDCFLGTDWGVGSRPLPWKTGVMLAYCCFITCCSILFGNIAIIGF